MAQPAADSEFIIEPRREVSPVTDDIIALSCPVPFDVGTVNVYLLLGEPLTLIDTGSRLNWTVDDLEALIRRAGVAMKELKQLILTHRHIDHFGVGAEVKERTGATVVASHIDGPFMAEWEGMVIGSREQFRTWGRAFGIPDDLFMLNDTWAKAIVEAARPVASDRLVKEGDIVEAGGRRLKVIESPGHTEGLITFFDEADGVYLANDHVLRHITPNPDVYSYEPANLRSGLPDYIESLKKIRDLPARIVLPGHGHELTDLAGRIDEVLVHHDQRADLVAEILATRPRSIFGIAGEVWPKLQPRDAHLAIREIIGHVVLLGRDGRVAHDWQDDVLIYRAT
ncbi:MAG: MBL fold metallo-hydrolase [Candidatus Dormibacteraeota bacterium]|nr:MBL fold metallo-hydrolase [Candidatus Dormibacteraeota bacterium]